MRKHRAGIEHKKRRFIFHAFVFNALFVFLSAPLFVSAESIGEDMLKKWDKISPWSEEKPPPPPEQKPFELPRLYSDKQHYNQGQ